MFCLAAQGFKCASSAMTFANGYPFQFDNDDKPQSTSPVASLYWLARDVKDSTHSLQRTGNVAPDVMVWPCYCLDSYTLNWNTLSKYRNYIHTYIQLSEARGRTTDGQLELKLSLQNFEITETSMITVIRPSKLLNIL